MDRRNAGGICFVMAVHSLGILEQIVWRYVLFLRVSHVTVQTLKQTDPQEYMEEWKRANSALILHRSDLLLT